MEIRRCDKCGTNLDPRQIRDYIYWDSDNLSAIKVTIPVLGGVSAPQDQQGLDDRDEFGGKFKKREIDLCEDCADSFAKMVSEWLPA